MLRTGRLVVDDITDRARYERIGAHVHASCRARHQRCAARRRRWTGRRIVVLANRTDGTAYAVTAAELLVLLDRERGSAAPVGCPG